MLDTFQLPGIVGLAAVAVILLWGIFVYNRLVTLRKRCVNQWHQIDIELKRRYDLVPKLVDTARAYASHERSAFEETAAARSRAMNAGSVGESSRSESSLAGSIRSIFAVCENYPDLRADGAYLDLQERLTKTENRIGYMRQFYNDTVMRYNTAIETIPGLPVARLFGFYEEEFFDIDVSPGDGGADARDNTPSGGK